MTEFGSSEAGKKGGEARAKSLDAGKRADIARLAAEARWGPTPVATHAGIMKLGELQLECAVLSDGQRVLSQRGFMRALGIKHGGRLAYGRIDEDGGTRYPLFVAQKALRPFIDKDLLAVLSNPVKYRPPQGGGLAYGVRAELIPQVCDIWLKARDAGVLRSDQAPIAINADIIIRGLAQVGIVALIDEATGYQDVRARDALAKILEAFVAKELRKWVKTFPPDYYRELFRLRGLAYPPNKNPPQYIGTLTNDIVYGRLAPGVRDDLKKKNPANEKGNRKAKHHQWLTENIGHPKLLQHLSAVIALMKVSKNYESFKKLLDQALPTWDDEPNLFRQEDS